MILVGDIMQEVPGLIEQLIEQNVLQCLLKEIQREIPHDPDVIPNVVYFVNMYCLVERGRELEKEYQIIEKVFECFTDRSYIEVLSCNKGLLKGKCIDSIALE